MEYVKTLGGCMTVLTHQAFCLVKNYFKTNFNLELGCFKGILLHIFEIILQFSFLSRDVSWIICCTKQFSGIFYLTLRLLLFLLAAFEMSFCPSLISS